MIFHRQINGIAYSARRAKIKRVRSATELRFDRHLIGFPFAMVRTTLTFQPLSLSQGEAHIKGLSTNNRHHYNSACCLKMNEVDIGWSCLASVFSQLL